MSDIAIRAENLGKRYRIGHREPYRTFRDALLTAARAPLRRLRNGRGQDDPHHVWALKDVSLEIQQGEAIGIIGRNGAGKSTLLKILSEITEPTTGSAEIHGRVSSLLEVGTGFHPELTGRENIYLNGAILGMSHAEIKRKFDEIVAFSEIEKYLDTPVKRYSSGMRVRLAFSVAAHLEPEVLIIDEVLAVGDASFQKKCLGKMKQVAGAGRTVLFVSHNLTTINSLCERAIWIDQGQIHRDGPSGVVVEKYLSDMIESIVDGFELESIDRTSTYGLKLRICKLTFNENTPIRHGAPLRIDIDYKAHSSIEKVSFGVGFVSTNGGRVMSCDSDIPGDRFRIVGAGWGRVTLMVPFLQLQPGRYFLDVGARSGDNKGVDYLPSFSQVEVLPGSNTPAVLIGRGDAGSVRIPVECQHTFCPPNPDMSAEFQLL